MIVLDHNIPRDQALLLRRWRLRANHIGFEVGRPEWQDQQEVLRYLHRLKAPTFFTRDAGFFRQRLSHPRICIVLLTGRVLDTAADIRRFLGHARFATRARRNGLVAKVTPSGVIFWEHTKRSQRRVAWRR